MGNTKAGRTDAPVDFRELVHDLRSALGAAIAYSDLARERIDRGETVTNEDLEPIARNLQRLADRIEQLDQVTRE